jgi:hypothetical protein
MKIILTILVLTLISSNSYSQRIKLSDIKDTKEISFKGNNTTNTASEDVFVPFLIIWPLNPMLVVENNKAYFALTKEVSLLLPRVTGKVGFEYSYVFRSDRNHHLRVFADYIIPLMAEDFMAIVLNTGVGYFTDTKKSGLFPQVSIGLLVPLGDAMVINLYGKVRETFMLKKEEADIFDASIGIGLIFYPY